ncbi:hypothetical protein D3C80_1470490 [compost metagenome]
MARHLHLGEQLGDHRPAIRMEGTVVTVQQPRFGEKIGTVPQAAEHGASGVGRPQLGPQQRIRLQAHAEPTADDQDVLLFLFQLRQAATCRNGDAQIADHHLACTTDHQHLIKRRRTHQVGGDQGVYRAGEGHHRKIIQQHEGDPLHWQGGAVVHPLGEVGHILVLQQALEGRSHVVTLRQ